MDEIIIIITGKPGSGKSLALSYITLALIDSGKFENINVVEEPDHVLTAKLKV